MTKLIWLLFGLFLAIFIVTANKVMIETPFHDFDEAHRAENAKQMKAYGSFFIPLTGSLFDREVLLSIPSKKNPILSLYYHLERPPLVYDLMIITTTIFGASEWAYRLPSFILGFSTILAFVFFARKFINKQYEIPLAVGVVALATSKDLWLSSQYAQLDTGITLFLFVSLLLLILYCRLKKLKLLVFSGVFLGLAILSKGQPAVIMIFPIIALLVLRKINLKELAIFFASTGLVVLPWVIYVAFRFGIASMLTIFTEFAFISALVKYLHHEAPFFWYVRWWWESLRPGLSLFLPLLTIDILRKNLSWEKITLLSFAVCGLVFDSISQNKIWWYVLPLIPALCFYIYLSCADYLKASEEKLIPLSLAIILASLPIFLNTSNKLTLLYGIIVFFLLLYLLYSKKVLGFVTKLGGALKLPFLLVAITTSFIFFYIHFPKITPYLWETKPVSQVFAKIPGIKCLWVQDIPAEAMLFYSDVEEIGILNEGSPNSRVFQDCSHNYLITPQEVTIDNKVFLRDIYGPTLAIKAVLYQAGSLKLIEL